MPELFEQVADTQIHKGELQPMTMTIIAWAMIIVFLALVMTKKMQPFTALLLVPLAFTLLGAFLGQYTDLVAAANGVDAASVTLWDQIKIIGDWTVAGVGQTANTGIMLLFAILYFAIMLNAGLFDPVTRAMIRFAKGDPVKVLLGTAIVAACVSLNGDGTTTTLICCTAFIPIYKKLNLKMMNLGVLVILMNTIMNLLPWGGPTIRAHTALAAMEGTEATVTEFFLPTLPAILVGLVCVFAIAILLGSLELIDGALLGGLVVVFSGQAAGIENALAYFREKNVGVEVIAHADPA